MWAEALNRGRRAGACHELLLTGAAEQTSQGINLQSQASGATPVLHAACLQMQGPGIKITDQSSSAAPDNNEPALPQEQ